jgi:hypothetical protein
MVTIDTHLARGGFNGGVTFHTKGGLHGRTNGAKRVVAGDVTGLPVAGIAVPANTTEGRATQLLMDHGAGRAPRAGPR